MRHLCVMAQATIFGRHDADHPTMSATEAEALFAQLGFEVHPSPRMMSVAGYLKILLRFSSCSFLAYHCQFTFMTKLSL